MGAPVFVFEGPDCVGKSTLAQLVAKKTGAVYLHATYKFKGRMYLYHLAMLRKALKIAETRPVVLDRWWPSEVAYGNAYRDGPEYGQDYQNLHKVADDYGFVYTFCIPLRWEQYWEFAKKNYHNQAQLYKMDEGKMKLVWRLYRDIALDNGNTFDRERLHYYNVVLDQYRCEVFARHIIDRYMWWKNYHLNGDRLELHKSIDWRSLKNVCGAAKEAVAQPTQLSLL